MKNQNSEQLRAIMRSHKLRPADVASLLGCSVWTVYHWLSNAPMPDRQMKFLELQLERQVAKV